MGSILFWTLIGMGGGVVWVAVVAFVRRHQWRDAVRMAESAEIIAKAERLEKRKAQEAERRESAKREAEARETRERLENEGWVTHGGLEGNRWGSFLLSFIHTLMMASIAMTDGAVIPLSMHPEEMPTSVAQIYTLVVDLAKVAFAFGVAHVFFSVWRLAVVQ